MVSADTATITTSHPKELPGYIGTVAVSMSSLQAVQWQLQICNFCREDAFVDNTNGWCLDVHTLMFVLFCMTADKGQVMRDHYEPLLETRRLEIAALAD